MAVGTLKHEPRPLPTSGSHNTLSAFPRHSAHPSSHNHGQTFSRPQTYSVTVPSAPHSSEARFVPPVGRGVRSDRGYTPNSSRNGRRRIPHLVVRDVQECRAATANLGKYTRLAVDCEGVKLSRTGRLCLIQVASPDTVYIFDLIDSDSQALFDAGGLKELLENLSVHKIIHDCRHDSDALYHQFGVKLGPVIDTQVMFSVMRRARGMEEGLPVSLKTLLRKFSYADDAEFGVKNTVKESMKDNNDFWLKRPLSEQALCYARFDVEHLLDISQILSRLINGSDKNAWENVLEESRRYLCLFRDDENGPRKAQQQYEQKARVARRQRVAFEQTKKAQLHRRNDPMRTFSFDHSRIVESLGS